MCIRNWLRRLFRRKEIAYSTKEEPIRRGNATAWSVIGEKKLKLSKKKAKALEKKFQDKLYWAKFTDNRKKVRDTIYINRISQLTEDKDKEE